MERKIEEMVYAKQISEERKRIVVLEILHKERIRGHTLERK